MLKWAMAGLLILASIVGIIYTIESIVVAERERADLIVEDDEIRFLASDFEFDQEVYRVTLGDTKKLSMRNVQGRHGIAIVGLDITLVQGDIVEYTFDKAGEYDVICNIACGIGHAEMVSKLIVEEAS